MSKKNKYEIKIIKKEAPLESQKNGKKRLNFQCQWSSEQKTKPKLVNLHGAQNFGNWVNPKPPCARENLGLKSPKFEKKTQKG